MPENLGNNFEYKELNHTSIGGIWGICTMDEKQETSLRRHMGTSLKELAHLMKIGKWAPLPKENSQRSYIMDENVMKWAHLHGKATIALTWWMKKGIWVS
jgi:hypothetical protein